MTESSASRSLAGTGTRTGQRGEWSTRRSLASLRSRRPWRSIAESRKKVLTEFTKSQRSKGLEAELAKAQSQERATKSEWEIQKHHLEKLEKAASAGSPRTEVEQRPSWP